MTAASTTPNQLSERDQRNNLWRLTIAQALAGANAVVIFATGAIVGNELAPSQLLATLPISVFVIGMAVCTLPAGVIARRYGRRAAFLTGTSAGVLVGLLSAIAVIESSFWLFNVATFFGGVYAAVVASFRFAATDGLAPEKQPHALAMVMAGGIAAGVVGPQLVTHSMHLWPDHLYAASFILQALVAFISGIILWGVRLPKPSLAEQAGGGRPLSTIVRQPSFVAAATLGAVSYMLMNFLMTAAPLAMHLEGHSHEAANSGIQWHVIAMYAPSFFTGKLIARFGALKVSLLGILLTAISTLIALTGNSVAHYWWMLVILGIGWNFGFLGASAWVLKCHSPVEKTRVQSFNDFIVYSCMVVGSFASGGLLSLYGWERVLWISFIPLVLSLMVLAYSQRAIKHPLA